MKIVLILVLINLFWGNVGAQTTINYCVVYNAGAAFYSSFGSVNQGALIGQFQGLYQTVVGLFGTVTVTSVNVVDKTQLTCPGTSGTGPEFVVGLQITYGFLCGSLCQPLVQLNIGALSGFIFSVELSGGATINTRFVSQCLKSGFIPPTTTTTTTTTTACVPNKQSSWSQTGNTVAGNSSGGSGSTLFQLSEPIPIYYDQPNNAIIIGDNDNHRVITFSLSNPSSGGTVIAGGNGGGCNTNQFYNTVGVALDSSRQLYVADSACGQILKFPSNSNSTTFGVFIAYLSLPEGIFIDPLTDDLYVAVYGANSVVKFASGSTTPVVVAGGNGVGNGLNQLNTPNGVYFDYLYTNSLYVLDSGNNRVLKFPSGSTSATFGTIVAGSNSSGNGSNQLNNPRNLVVDSNEILYITDQYNNRVQRWLPNASSGDTIIGGTEGTASNQLNNPEGIIFDENYNILVVDRHNNRVQLFNVGCIPPTTTTTTTTSTTTTRPYCATTCSGSFSNYDNTTTCGHLCHDIGTYSCISGSTYCPGLYFRSNGNLDGTCNGTPCPSGYCCVYDDYGHGNPYLCLIQGCGSNG